MEMKMKEATLMLDMDSKDNSSSKKDDNSSVLHFCGAVWDMYGPDVNNIIAAVNVISLQVQTQEGSREHRDIK